MEYLYSRHLPAKNSPMKNVWWFCVLNALLFSHPVRASEPQIVPSSIEKVTVFLNRSQIFRKADVRLSAGQTLLAIDGVSPLIDLASIQASGKGNFIILDVQHRVDLRAPEPLYEPDEIKQWSRKVRLTEDSLLELGYDLQLVTLRREALVTEKATLLGHPLMINTAKSDTLPVLKDALFFLREKLEDIHRNLIQTQEKEQRMQTAYTAMNTRLMSWTNYRNNLLQQQEQPPGRVHQILVTVYARQPAQAKIEVNYTAMGASWSPAYDVRSDGPGKPVKLTYKANVRQQTGEDWNDVPLTLSTHDPNLRQQKPELPIWYVQYYQEIRQAAIQSLDLLAPEVATYAGSRVEDESAVYLDDAAKAAHHYTQVAQTFSNVQFTIDLGYVIPSDGQERLILVQEKELDATYRHFLVPKLDRESFIQARITGWEELNLLPGAANLFYDGTFIGRAVLDPRIFGDTLDLPMGRDRMVYADRKPLDTEEKNKLIGGNKVRTESFSIEVRNNYSTAINLVVQDQIPVAADPDIKVSLKSGDPDRHIVPTGMLEWDIELAAGSRKKWSFSYEVEWDKNRRLQMR